jgi:hypothetical protein
VYPIPVQLFQSENMIFKVIISVVSVVVVLIATLTCYKCIKKHQNVSVINASRSSMPSPWTPPNTSRRQVSTDSGNSGTSVLLVGYNSTNNSTLMCQTSTGLDVWQVVRRDGGQVDGKWMADA